MILQSVGEGVIVIGADKKVIIINDRARNLLGKNLTINPGMEIGKIFENCVEKEAFLKNIDNKSFLTMELHITDIIPKILFVSATSFKDQNEQSFGRVLILHDVTKAKEVNRIQNDFISSVSHELRTPLTSILGFSSTILRKKNIPEETKTEFLEIIQKESKRLSHLIEDLLSISKNNSGETEYNFKKVSFINIVKDVIDVFKPQADKKGIKLSFEYENDLPMISGDHDSLHQVVLNFVSNAIKFTNANGKIDITLQKYANSVLFEISDDGLGIPLADQNKIYDKFFRVYRPGLEIPGTGLGLSIAKQIIDAHNGIIKLKSKPDSGSRFMIFLPISIKDIEDFSKIKKSTV